jgi:hypothetical protein
MIYAQWVKHHQVEDYLRLGWMVAIPDRYVSHDHWAVLMLWLCACEMRRPTHAEYHQG